MMDFLSVTVGRTTRGHFNGPHVGGATDHAGETCTALIGCEGL